MVNKYIFLFMGIVLLTGCSKYSYVNKSYHSPSYSKAQNDKLATKKVKIKNSSAMHRATMRPYVVFGKKYYPTVAKINDKFEGVASWYGPDFHAKKTSNGEIYNMYDMTAAHKTLPMNTVVRVENLVNNKTIVVRINDRGPFVTGRIIDLSNIAAHKIDMVKTGTVNVRLTVIGFNAKVAVSNSEKKQKMSVGNYFLQVGVFSKRLGAETTKRKFKMILDENRYRIVIKDDYINNKKIKRVLIGGFKSEQEAVDFKNSNNLTGSMIIAQ